MQNRSPKTSKKSQRGVALFIAIFALLLISVVALALMVMAARKLLSTRTTSLRCRLSMTHGQAWKRRAAGCGWEVPIRS